MANKSTTVMKCTNSLQKHNLSKSIQDETENLNSPISIKETILSKTSQKSQTQMASLMHFIKI